MTTTTLTSVLGSSKLCYLVFGIVLMLATQECIPQDGPAYSSKAEQRWVDSVYNELSENERLGQLFMIRAHSDKGDDHIASVESLIKKYHVGSLCFFQGTPEKQAELVNRYQALSKIPLMVAIDGEWGLGMRMRESTISFPRQLTLGAIQDNRLIYEMGAEIARQLRRTGVTVNFAPVVDVNNNAKNPVINVRSFGEDRANVAAKGFEYMKGMQDHGVLACAKHFPGHGDTDVDSHFDLPVINHKRERLDSIELMPFKILFEKGVGSVMVAHLHVPALDARPNRPTTLSRNTVTNLMKQELGFDGLVFTDALEMKGVTKHFRSGQVEAEALMAGNDVLVLPEDLEAAFREIKKYIADGRIAPRQVENSVKNVLRTKYRLGLTQYQPVPVENIRAELNNAQALALKQKLYENAITLVRNEESLLPFGKLDFKIASLAIGAEAKTPFQKRIDSYAKVEHFNTGKEIAPTLSGKLKGKDIVIVSLHDMSPSAAKGYGISRSTLDFISNLSKEIKVVLVIFGTPYSLQYFDYINWILAAYEEDPMAQDAAARALFGGMPVKGKLPVTASAKSSYGAGIIIERATRLGYARPEEVGLNPTILASIDSIAMEAIEAKATPGCVVLVAKDGQIVYEKAFGHHTYSGQTPVKEKDLYDLASITKIAATTLAVMKLYDEGKIDIDKTLGFYLPELRGTNKANLTIRDVMTHRAGLLSWIPFYKQTVVRSRRKYIPSPQYYRRVKDNRFSVQVTDKLYMRKDFVDTMWKQIYASGVRNGGYRYSDLGFYLMSRVIQQVTGKTIDQYVQEALYEPLGLATITYNPTKRFPLEQIVPTEEDNYFRAQRVHGYVHDMGAAMLGGVSGHAGLFSNAHDLAVLMQMLIQQGHYGNHQMLDSNTVRIFTRREPMSTRSGIGFDLFKTNPNMKRGMPQAASGRTFGHIGFTGTCAWADPVNHIVYIFLANRTYPSKDNYKINRLGIRSRIFSVVYDAMEDGVKPDDFETRPTQVLPTVPLPAAVSSNQQNSAAERVN